MRKLMQKRQSMFAGRFRTGALVFAVAGMFRSEEHTSELQSH